MFLFSLLALFSNLAKPQKLGLILGLSLGIGIPATVSLVASAVYYVKKIKANGKVSVNKSTGTNEFQMSKTNDATESSLSVTA